MEVIEITKEDLLKEDDQDLLEEEKARVSNSRVDYYVGGFGRLWLGRVVGRCPKLPGKY